MHGAPAGCALAAQQPWSSGVARSCIPAAPPLPLCLQASQGGVAVRGLFAASPSQLALLKQGEQEKQKSYVAVGAVQLELLA